jgi:DNA-binding Xre family transcriptional regulator
MKSIAKQIDIELIKRDMKRKDLAKLLGIAETNLSMMLNRDTYKTETLQKIADVLGCELVISFLDKSEQ